MFTGTISWISTSGKFAYIDRKSVTGTSGQLVTRKDVYIHQDDCPVKLYVGRTLNFETVADPRRKDAFRATKIEVPGPSAIVGWAIGLLTIISSIAALFLIFPYQSSAGMDEVNPLAARDAPIFEAFAILCMIPMVAFILAFAVVMTIAGIIRFVKGSEDPDLTRVGMVIDFSRGGASYVGSSFLMIAAGLMLAALFVTPGMLAYKAGIASYYVTDGGMSVNDHAIILPWIYLTAIVLGALGVGFHWMAGSFRKA